MADPAPKGRSGGGGATAAPLLAAADLVRTHGARRVLDGVSLAVAEGERIGLLGANGAGKTTLLRILAGVEAPEDGRITRRRGLRLAYLPQETDVDPAATVAAAAASGQAERRARIAELEALDGRIGAAPDASTRARLLERRAEAEHEVERLGGLDPDRDVAVATAGLGLPHGDALCGSLSGGERRRVALARVLLAQPDLLLLDEPTNHLDAGTIDWLETWLATFRGAAVVVTHDRAFLDAIVSRMVEIDRGRLHEYEGDYERFLEERAERLEREEATDVSRRAYLRRELLWLASGVKAQRRKGKERVDRARALARELGEGPAVPSELEFRLPGGPRLGQKVLELDAAGKRAGERWLFRGLTLRLSAGERLGVVGRNGAGKTTLLRVMQGLEAPDAGRVVIGPSTRFAYVDQARVELDPEKTVYEEVAGDSEFVQIGPERISVRAYLTRFLFPGERQQHFIRGLSGGERNRVALAKLLRAGGNVLLLDEPTNDLDLATLRVLEEALVAFEGAAVVVSHDRWFLDRVATRVLGLDGDGDGRFAIAEGGYASWREAREAREAASPSAPSPAPSPRGVRPARALTAREKNELDGMEAAIEAAEAEIARLARLLEDGSLYADPSRRDEARALAASHSAAQARVSSLYARWDELERRREERAAS